VGQDVGQDNFPIFKFSQLLTLMLSYSTRLTQK